MPYALKDWIAMSPRDKQLAIEGLAKSHSIRRGGHVVLDARLIGTDIHEARVVEVKLNTAWDRGADISDDRLRYPDIETNLTIVVEGDDGKTIEVNWREILKVENR